MAEKSFLESYSNSKLDENLKQLIVSEREILSEIILHISEVASRKLYLTYGYPSLFEYLTKRMGYANGSAQRRIDAARLSHDVPEVIDHLESGKINLSQVSVVAQSLRQVAINDKGTGNEKSITPEFKVKLVADLCDKSIMETQVLVSQALSIPIKEITKTKYQKDESIRLEVTFTKEQWKKLTLARELLSHSIPSGSWDQVFEYMSDQVIKKKCKTSIVKSKNDEITFSKPERITSSTRSRSKTNENTRLPRNSFAAKAIKSREHIPIAIQREVHRRDQRCQYQDKVTGHKCDSTWKLTLDHVQPVWAQGDNILENLRLLCAHHNREVYRQQSGIRNL